MIRKRSRMVREHGAKFFAKYRKMVGIVKAHLNNHVHTIVTLTVT